MPFIGGALCGLYALANHAWILSAGAKKIRPVRKLSALDCRNRFKSAAQIAQLLKGVLMIKCVSFDFDGTLVDSNDIKRDTFFEIALPWDASGEVVKEVFERWPAANRYEKTRKIAEGLINRKLLPKEASVSSWGARLANDYTISCENSITKCGERPGASQALKGLSEMGLLLFVNSGTPTGPLQRLLELRKWSHFFHAAYGAEGLKAENLKSIAMESGATQLEIVHVGDQSDDWLGAKEFGCHFVAMVAACTVSTVKESPLLIEDLRDLPALIERLSREVS